MVGEVGYLGISPYEGACGLASDGPCQKTETPSAQSWPSGAASDDWISTHEERPSSCGQYDVAAQQLFDDDSRSLDVEAIPGCPQASGLPPAFETPLADSKAVTVAQVGMNRQPLHLMDGA